MTFSIAVLFSALTVGTWNGNWFPSGRAEHRAPEAVEQAMIEEAGRMIKEGLAKADPTGKNDLILCFNEFRHDDTAEKLVKAIGRSDLKVAVVSGYRRRDRFDQQQDVIATTLPVAESNWSKWKNSKKNTPPRGYAHALIVIEPAVTASVYSVHLKSNYGATTAEIAESNRLKRAKAIEQIVGQEKPKRSEKNPHPVIIAGDFNADRWSAEFAEETIFKTLEDGGYFNSFELAASDKRATHPGRGKWGDSTLDYVFTRGMKPFGAPVIVPAKDISDHNPVFVNF